MTWEAHGRTTRSSSDQLAAREIGITLDDGTRRAYGFSADTVHR